MAFRVQGELSLDGSKFFAVLNRAKGAVAGVGSSIASSIGGRLAAAFSVGAISMMAKRTIDFADSIDTMSVRLGVGTDKLQEWILAAKLAGADAGTLTNFIEQLSSAAADLKNAPVFEQMGINPAGMTPEQLFSGVSKWSQGKQSTDISAVLGQIIDTRAIGKMMGVLQSDLDAVGETARKMGAVMDGETIAGLKNFKAQMEILGTVLLSNFAPALIWAGKAAIGAFAEVKGWAAWFGARTSNINWKDILMLPMGGWANLIQKWVEGGKAGLDEEADSERQRVLDQFDEMLRRLQEHKPVEPPVITPSDNDKTSERKSAAQSHVPSDSLVSVGNFLGASMRGMVAVQTLLVARQQLVTLRSVEGILKSNLGGIVKSEMGILKGFPK